MASTVSSKGTGLTSTPRSSPKPSPQKLLYKVATLRLSLNLQKVLGSTCVAPNAFDVLDSPACFAYTAGAVLVVCTVGEDGALTQRFFGAKPNACHRIATTPTIASPLAPASPGPRTRTANRIRDSNTRSYFPSPKKDGHSSPGSPKSTLKEKIKTLSCVSLSRDGNLLAVGEVGHKPRIMVFSTATDGSADVPIITLAEHKYGVHCLAFSPDSQYLASMGELNDGFLHVWKVDRINGTADLYASGKSTNNVRQIAWLGDRLITVGTRHVKLWRSNTGGEGVPEDSRNLAVSTVLLEGRNCLLGALMDQAFTTIAAISTDKAIICSNRGDICILSDSAAGPSFLKIAHADFGITAAAVRLSKFIVVGGDTGAGLLFRLEDVLEWSSETAGPHALIDGLPLQLQIGLSATVALGFLTDDLLIAGAEKTLKVLTLNSDGHTQFQTAEKCATPAHRTAILGVRPLPIPNYLHASFLTWSTDGIVSFWAPDGSLRRAMNVVNPQNPKDVELRSELSVVEPLHHLRYIACGDKNGVLRFVEITSSTCFYRHKAHIGEIVDIAVCGPIEAAFVATVGRDRYAQVFRWTNAGVELLQTLDEHASSINHVLFNNCGKMLITSSADRTVVIRETLTLPGETEELPTFVKSRSIVLKSTPLSMAIDPSRSNILYVSSADHSVSRFSTETGTLLSSFKVIDGENADSLDLNIVTRFPWGQDHALIAGVAKADKSVRVYDEAGRLMACEFGHTEGIAGLAVFEDPTRATSDTFLVTVGADSTIFVWKLSAREGHLPFSGNDARGQSSASLNMFELEAPLRKILSAAEITRLQAFRNTAGNSSESSVGALESPTGSRPRRLSKLSISRTPDRRISTFVSGRHEIKSPTLSTSNGTGFQHLARSPSPARRSQAASPLTRMNSNPRMQTPKQGQDCLKRKPNIASEAKGEPSELLQLATDEMCRNLQEYRKKLATVPDKVLAASAMALERELDATMAALAEKTMGTGGPHELDGGAGELSALHNEEDERFKA